MEKRTKIIPNEKITQEEWYVRWQRRKVIDEALSKLEDIEDVE